MKKYGKGYYLLPAKSHNPLLQGAIITDFGKGNTDATLFFDFLKTPVADKIFKTYGFIQEIE